MPYYFIFSNAIYNLATSKNHLYNYLINFKNYHMPSKYSKALTDTYLLQCLNE